jgi:hypothetical protein
MCEERQRRNGHHVTRNTTRKLNILEKKTGFDVSRRRRRRRRKKERKKERKKRKKERKRKKEKEEA